MKICAIIPSHNHTKAIRNVIAALLKHNLEIFVVDDGSAENFRKELKELASDDKKVTVIRLPVNQGKGGAVIAGFKAAHREGFTHALQIDADGQHDVDAIPELLSLAQRHPLALITGQPIYDASIPKGRKIGRWVTHVWVWIETLSFKIKDSMCGFRIYPLQAVMDLISNEKIGQRMDFDTDIMVRLYWRGVDVISVPVKVIYPEGNTSNFDMLHDNLRISAMHTKLVFLMLARLPSKIFERDKSKNHWSSLQERGTYYGLAFCALTYKILGRRACKFILAFISLYFFVFGKKQRDASRKFLQYALGRKPSLLEGYKHFFNFALRSLDILAGWNGDLPKEMLCFDSQNPSNDLEPGALLIVSHMGNSDVSRALMDKDTRDRMTLLVHTKHAVNYNRAIKEFQPEAAMNMMQITDIGPDTIMNLKQRIENGEYIVIAGDRTSASSQGHVSNVDFLGHEAPFAHGPWILGALLECPVYLLFCIPDNNGKYVLSIEKFSDKLALPRQNRAEVLKGYCQSYALRLESYARQAPFQWFNFFNFWAQAK